MARKTFTVQYEVWRDVKKLEADEEIWGKSKAIRFLLDQYKKIKNSPRKIEVAA